MNAICKQLAHAYSKEERLYLRVRGLVRRQKALMETEPNPAAVVDLCGEVERLMGQIALIEEAIEPTKQRRSTTRKNVDAELDGVLAKVQATIEDIARTQVAVQDMLVDYTHRRESRPHPARPRVGVGRARVAYG